MGVLSRKYKRPSDGGVNKIARFLGHMLQFGFKIPMQPGRRNILMRRAYLHRGLVLLIFILILADLALPQRCCEELNFPSEVTAATYFDNGLRVVLATDQTEQHPESPDPDIGCFCCCAHFLHSNIQSADFAAVKWPVTALAAPFLPSSPPQDRYRPPRSA